MNEHLSALDAHTAPSPEIAPKSTSYFSRPESSLDPRLFGEDNHMHQEVRQDLLSKFDDHMRSRYTGHESWSRVWLAGSGASYQWAAARDPGDLDMLVGVDYPKFRYLNPQYARLSDGEISKYMTQQFREDLSPSTAAWSPPTHSESNYEVTWYSNPASHDIRAIKPYAAYEIRKRRWDVEPDPNPVQPSYDAKAEQDRAHASTIVKRYLNAKDAVASPGTPLTARQRHMDTMVDALQQASALFTDIHEGRHSAFGPGGKGYADPANYRWQAGKASGVVGALKTMHDFLQDTAVEYELHRYGVRLPDADDLLLRALITSDR